MIDAPLTQIVIQLRLVANDIETLQIKMQRFGAKAEDHSQMKRLLQIRSAARASIRSAAHQSMYDLPFANLVVLNDLKYRLSLPAGDEARIGADELLDELNRISPPIKESVPIPVCSLTIGQTPTVISAIEHLFKHQRADIIKYLNNSCE